jgi:hypothetical protein
MLIIDGFRAGPRTESQMTRPTGRCDRDLGSGLSSARSLPRHPGSEARRSQRTKGSVSRSNARVSANLGESLSVPHVNQRRPSCPAGADRPLLNDSSARALCSTAGALLADRVPWMPSSGAPLSPIPRSPAGRGTRRVPASERCADARSGWSALSVGTRSIACIGWPEGP